MNLAALNLATKYFDFELEQKNEKISGILLGPMLRMSHHIKQLYHNYLLALVCTFVTDFGVAHKCLGCEDI